MQKKIEPNKSIIFLSVIAEKYLVPNSKRYSDVEVFEGNKDLSKIVEKIVESGKNEAENITIWKIKSDHSLFSIFDIYDSFNEEKVKKLIAKYSDIKKYEIINFQFKVFEIAR